ADAVLGPDAAAMRLDDLLGNGEAEAGILAKALLRPVGIEALENLLQRVRADAGAVVVHRDLDLAAQAPADHPHGAARRRERARIVDQVVDYLPDAGIVARHHEVARAAAFEPERYAHVVLAAHLVGDRHQRVEELCQVDRADLLALQLGVEATGIRD